MNRLTKLVIAVGAITLVAMSGLQISIYFRAANASAPTSPSVPPTVSKPSAPPELAGMNATNFKSVVKGNASHLRGMEPSGKFSISFGPAPDYFLTKTSADGTSTTLAPIGTMFAAPIPNTNKIVFTSVGDAQGPCPVLLINEDGTGLKKIGSTETPWRVQVTDKGLVAYRAGESLVIYNSVSGATSVVPGVTLTGEYPNTDTMWNVSPDASKVALRDGDSLTLVDTVTGQKRLVGGALDRMRDSIGAWSPDGTLFAYATEPRTSGDKPTLWVASPQVQERNLFGYPTRDGKFLFIAWPDNSRLVASHIPGGPLVSSIPNTEYYGVSTKGGAKLLFTNGYGLSVSPDGHRVFFMRQNTANSLTDFDVVQGDVQ